MSDVPDETLAEIELLAVELARLAGAEIVSALGRSLAVTYKDLKGAKAALLDPVSEVDHRVERLIRARLSETFPEHDVLGEEIDERPGRDHDFLWAVDPVDGTANFVNGFPLFAGSLGVLHKGRPVVGAVWCSTSHALRPGVYHARLGGPLRFDGEAMSSRPNPAVRRRLVGMPHAPEDHGRPWDVRKTGSAAVECAFVAAGLLRAARFERPNVWDVAGGFVLVGASGGVIRVGGEGGWRSMEAFPGQDEIASWRRPVLIGEAEAVGLMAEEG